MAVNKVEYGGRTLIDLTGDTVTPETLVQGATAHNAAGEMIEGKNMGSSGDMLKSDYDPESAVQEAGGIAAYVDGTIYSDDSETTPENILSTTEEVLRKVYPVGAVYMSVNSADPADLFGFGTWERVKDRFLLAAGDSHAAGSTGGEENVALTSDQNGPHYHSLATVVEGPYVHIGQWGWKVTAEQISNENGYDSYGMVTQMNGEGMPHNNMPPYLAVYIWKRTA